jgi:hypothetical protein
MRRIGAKPKFADFSQITQTPGVPSSISGGRNFTPTKPHFEIPKDLMITNAKVGNE